MPATRTPKRLTVKAFFLCSTRSDLEETALRSDLVLQGFELQFDIFSIYDMMPFRKLSAFFAG